MQLPSAVGCQSASRFAKLPKKRPVSALPGFDTCSAWGVCMRLRVNRFMRDPKHSCPIHHRCQGRTSAAVQSLHKHSASRRGSPDFTCLTFNLVHTRDRPKCCSCSAPFHALCQTTGSCYQPRYRCWRDGCIVKAVCQVWWLLVIIGLDYEDVRRNRRWNKGNSRPAVQLRM